MQWPCQCRQGRIQASSAEAWRREKRYCGSNAHARSSEQYEEKSNDESLTGVAVNAVQAA